MLVQAGGTKVLLDAGIPVKQLQKRLSKFRVTLADVDGLFLTHEHGDHAYAVWSLSKKYRIPVIANPATLTVLEEQLFLPTSQVLDTGESLPFKDLLIESFPVSHDAVDPVGYNVYYKDRKASFVTDTGVAGEEILRKIEDSSLVILESNYDHDSLISGPYPEFLKRRILSSYGHLSNEHAADLMIRHLRGVRRPVCVWLAHLSKTNNTPRLARRYMQRRLSEAGHGNTVVEVIPRDYAGLTWRSGIHAIQMDLPLGNG